MPITTSPAAKPTTRSGRRHRGDRHATARTRTASAPQVERMTVVDPHSLPANEQATADALVAELEAEARAAAYCGDNASPLEDAERFPSLPEWLLLRKSALSLHPLYRATSADRLADGLSYDDFLAPRFGGRSAVEVLEAAIGEDRASRIAHRHEVFCSAPMTAAARYFMQGSLDPMAIRQRAIVTSHLIAARQERWHGDVQIASVACGAAGPVAEIAAGLDAAGIESIGLTLLDRDPMALAAAQVIAAQSLPSASLRSQIVDLVDMQRCRAVDLAPMAGDGWDVVDVLGLFEYLPDVLAVDLLRSARAALRPGGIIVVANMLDKRPQQTFFSDVVRWPAVIQRSPEQFMRLISAAGFATKQVSLAIAENAPIYTVAALDTAA